MGWHEIITWLGRGGVVVVWEPLVGRGWRVVRVMRVMVVELAVVGCLELRVRGHWLPREPMVGGWVSHGARRRGVSTILLRAIVWVAPSATTAT